MTTADLTGVIRERQIVVEACNSYMSIVAIPPQYQRELQSGVVVIVASNERYLVLAKQRTRDEVVSSGITRVTTTPLYVVDKKEQKWHPLAEAGSCSRERLFGDWLAVIVQNWDPTHKPNPSINNERGTATETKPDVRFEYAHDAADGCYIPGVLKLYNLSSGKEHEIVTRQQDSEVLTVSGRHIIYRVNDELYDGRITPQNQIHSRRIAKDDNLPEVHWAFMEGR